MEKLEDIITETKLRLAKQGKDGYYFGTLNPEDFEFGKALIAAVFKQAIPKKVDLEKLINPTSEELEFYRAKNDCRFELIQNLAALGISLEKD